MKKNTEILQERGELGNIRERLGARDENDASKDSRIDEMSPKEVAAKWAGYNIGSEGWAYDIIGIYEALGGSHQHNFENSAKKARCAMSRGAKFLGEAYVRGI